MSNGVHLENSNLLGYFRVEFTGIVLVKSTLLYYFFLDSILKHKVFFGEVNNTSV